jgi:hypothetical protein
MKLLRDTCQCFTNPVVMAPLPTRSTVLHMAIYCAISDPCNLGMSVNPHFPEGTLGEEVTCLR